MGLVVAPQLATAVVELAEDDVPAVLVEVIATLAVDVPRAGLEGGFDDPHTVFLEARQVWVEVVGLEDVGVLHRAVVQAEAVVGHEQFLLAHQLPVVAIRCAVEAVEAVGGDHAVAVARAVVIGDQRGTTYAALAGNVLPGGARFGDLVHRLVGQHGFAGQPRRFQHAGLEQVEDVGVGRQVGNRLGVVHLGLRAHQAVDAVLLHVGRAEGALDAAAAVAGDVVPDRLDALPGQRERDAPVVIQHAVAAIGELALLGVPAGFGVDLVRQPGAAVAGVDVDPVGIRVALEHRLLARAEPLAVLRGVGRSDGEQRLLGGVGVGVAALGVDLPGVGRQAAVPAWDGAVGIGGLLGAHRGEFAAQVGNGVGVGANGQAHGQRQGGDSHELHRQVPQKSTLALTL